MGPPITSGPLAAGPTINGRDIDPNLSPQRGNSGFLVYPKEIHTLNDAILAAGKALSTRPQGSRRIIYVISDGKESRSKANYREVVRYLERNQIAVYGTLVGDSATWGIGYLDRYKIPLLPLSPDNILPRYTSDTGGHLYSEFSTNGIERSFAELAVPGTHPVHPWLLQSRTCDGRQIPQPRSYGQATGCYSRRQEGVLPDSNQPLAMILAALGHPGLSFVGLGLAASAFWGASDFLGGLATRKAHVVLVVAMAHSLSLGLLLLIALSAHAPLPTLHFALAGLCAGAFGGSGAPSLLPGIVPGRDGDHDRPDRPAHCPGPGGLFIFYPGLAQI